MKAKTGSVPVLPNGLVYDGSANATQSGPRGESREWWSSQGYESTIPIKFVWVFQILAGWGG